MEKRIDVNPEARIATNDTTRIEVDEYTITDKMIADNIHVDAKSPADQAVFASETSNELIHLILATDYYRATSIHYDPSNADKLYEQKEFKQIQALIENPSLQPSIINHSYFQTKRGIKLGDSKSHVVETYGQMDKIRHNQNFKILQWNYFGEELLGDEENTDNLRVAKNSLGHLAELFFENDKLVGIIFRNYIP